MMPYDIPDVYMEEITPSGAPIKPVGSGVVGLVGKFAQGDVNIPTRCGSWEEFSGKFGGLYFGSAAYDAWVAFKNKAPAVVVVRVQGTAASVTIQDRQATPQDKAKFTAWVDGEGANYEAGPPQQGVQVIIADGTITGTFRLTVKAYYLDRDSSSEETYQEVFDNLSPDPAAARYFVNVVNGSSMVIKAEDLNPTGTGEDNRPANGSYDLAGGTEPDYTNPSSPTGIDKLEEVDDVSIVIADRDDSQTRNTLIDHCNTMGDRICFLNPPAFSSVDEVNTIADALDEDRASLVYPWIQVNDPSMGNTRCLRPASFAAGIAARLDPHLPMTNHKALGAVGTQSDLTRANIVSLNDHGVLVIHRWDNRGIRCRNNLNLSSETAKQRVNRRRLTDYIQESIAQNFGWAVGQPHTPSLRDSVKGSLVNWFRNLQADNWIESFFVKCDEENNPPEIVEANKLVVRYGVRMWSDADFIIFRSEIGNVVQTEVE